MAFLGPEGTFTQQAVLKHFGHSVRALPLPRSRKCSTRSRPARADFGVVPIENSTEGTVNNTLDMFLTSPLDLRRGRAAHPPVPDGPHDSARARCSASARTRRRWRSAAAGSTSTCRASSACRSSSNAEGARRARDEDGTAAIAGEAAAEVYGLNCWCPEIEDRPDNTTRFLVIGRKSLPPSGQDKTTLLVSARAHRRAGRAVPAARAAREATHQHDAHRVAAVAASASGTTCSSSTSRATPTTEPLAAALAELKGQASLFRVLGSYPRAML